MREFARALRRELVWWLGGFARLLRRHPAGLLGLAGVGLLSWAIGIDLTGFWLVIGGPAWPGCVVPALAVVVRPVRS